MEIKNSWLAKTLRVSLIALIAIGTVLTVRDIIKESN